MRVHGSVLLYVPRNHKAHQNGEPRTAPSTFTQLLNSDHVLPPCCSLVGLIPEHITERTLSVFVLMHKTVPFFYLFPFRTYRKEDQRADCVSVWTLSCIKSFPSICRFPLRTYPREDHRAHNVSACTLSRIPPFPPFCCSPSRSALTQSELCQYVTLRIPSFLLSLFTTRA